MKTLVALALPAVLLAAPASATTQDRPNELHPAPIHAYKVRAGGGVVNLFYATGGGSELVEVRARRRGARLVGDVLVSTAFDDSLRFRCVGVRVGTEGLRRVIQAHPRRRVPRARRLAPDARRMMRRACRNAPVVTPAG